MAFELVGFEQCESPDHEPGFEKVAIYADDDGAPTHAARQLEDGRWASKLGDWEDIEHESPENLESGTHMRSKYGEVALVMRRNRG